MQATGVLAVQRFNMIHGMLYSGFVRQDSSPKIQLVHFFYLIRRKPFRHLVALSGIVPFRRCRVLISVSLVPIFLDSVHLLRITFPPVPRGFPVLVPVVSLVLALFLKGLSVVFVVPFKLRRVLAFTVPNELPAYATPRGNLTIFTNVELIKRQNLLTVPALLYGST